MSTVALKETPSEKADGNVDAFKVELQDWIDSIDDVIDRHTAGNVRILLTRLICRAVEKGCSLPVQLSDWCKNSEAEVQRDLFLANRRREELDRGREVDEDSLMNDWYCSEEFSQLLSSNFYIAKSNALLNP